MFRTLEMPLIKEELVQGIEWNRMEKHIFYAELQVYYRLVIQVVK